MKIAIIGAGVAGLSLAVELLSRNIDFEIFEAAEEIGSASCSYYAGGMLAPYCEAESAEPQVVTMGGLAAHWWDKNTSQVRRKGSLVLATGRDKNELKRFAARTSNYAAIDGDEIAQLEPDLAGRFNSALYFQSEAHLNPRKAILELADKVIAQGKLHLGQSVSRETLSHDLIVDCRGFHARQDMNELRGVRGEMLILKCADISLNRPIRLVHPRYPLYIVPRDNENGENDMFMLGATMIESSQRGAPTARSIVELLNAAYALHPAFGEASIEEIGCDIRPAFSDNLPQITRQKQEQNHVLSINGLYRHGFLLGPAMAIKAANMIEKENA